MFKPLPFADQNFDQILDPLETNDEQFSKIYTLFRRKMNFWLHIFAFLKKFRKIVIILQKSEIPDSLKMTPFADFRG